MPTIVLSGCSPIPLAYYLKGLGILRLVAEQLDQVASASWQSESLKLRSSATAESLIEFFCHSYSPSPVLAPWNGGSGFFPKDNDKALLAIEASLTPRLASYRVAISAARRELNALNLKAKPEGDTKNLLLQGCRNSFPEEALAWLDAVFVLTQDGAKFPPLLGTGGNDGRLEFTNNFMQRIIEVIDPQTGKPTPGSERWLRASMFGDAAPGITTRAPIGQFLPGAAGGPNATSGFDAPSTVNPWDFILMIEGALLFAAASVKRLEHSDDASLVYPFCVRQAGVGYPSASPADEADSRCEMWMPLWTEPTGLSELRAILSEGRAQIRGRAAANGVDFAQAVVTLGVDRGIASFQRYGFQVRNGLSYFATPLDRVIVRRNSRADLLADIEPWLGRLRQKTGPRAKPAAPASVTRALNRVERHILQLCREDSPANLQSLLATLGAAERALARSLRWTTEAGILPLYGLRPDWLTHADDGSPEFRLAQALAGTRAWFGDETLWFRQHLEPVSIKSSRDRSWVRWDDSPGNDVAWHDGDLTNTLNDILARRILRVTRANVRGWPDWSPRPAKLAEITDFIEHRTDDELLADLLWGLSLINWQQVEREEKTAAPESHSARQPPGDDDSALTERTLVPSSFYALLRLCLCRPRTSDAQDVIPVDARIFHKAMAGSGEDASSLAARRLHGSGKSTLVDRLPVSGHVAPRTAAALLFPIRPRDLSIVEETILKPTNQ